MSKTLEVTLATKLEADAVLNTAKRLLKTYGQLFVSDLKDLIGETPAWEDEQYSWVSIDEVKIEERDNQFVVIFPEPTPYIRY